MPTVALIANPASGGGRGHRRLAQAERALAALGSVQVIPTRTAGDEARCAAEALDAAPRWIAVLGGDGTWGNVAGGLAGRAGAPPVLLLAAGTGNDFAKSLGAPAHDFAAMATLAESAGPRRVDVGRIDDRPFLNCAGFGFDARVCEAMQAHRRLTGRAVYVLTALQQLFAYRGLSVGIDGGPPRRRLMLAFCNGRWFGGTFHIAPSAAVDDGRLDVVGIDDATPLRRATLFARAFRGTHVAQPEVTVRSAAEVRLTFDAPPIFEADGEFCRAAGPEVTVGLVPGGLSVVA